MLINQSNMQGIYKSFSTIFKEAFDGAPSQWPIVAMEVPSTSRSEDYKWLGDFPMMREWLGERVIKDLSSFSYEIKNRDFESTIEVDRNDIEDDQIGVYTPMIKGLAWSAKQHPDTLVFNVLQSGFNSPCFDKTSFFATDHPVGDGFVSNFGGDNGTPWFLMCLSRPVKPLVLQIRKRPEFVAMDHPQDEEAFMRKKYRYGVDDRKNAGYGLWQLAYGSKQDLNLTNYAAARAAMQKFKNTEGVPLGIVPTHLVVPPDLEGAGRSLLNAVSDAAGASNVWYQSAELVVSPWL